MPTVNTSKVVGTIIEIFIPFQTEHFQNGSFSEFYKDAICTHFNILSNAPRLKSLAIEKIYFACNYTHPCL